MCHDGNKDLDWGSAATSPWRQQAHDTRRRKWKQSQIESILIEFGCICLNMKNLIAR